MSNYTQTVDFGPKDSLASGDPAKLILGTEIDTELQNIATAITSKYDSSSIATSPVPFASGTVSLPSIYLGGDTTTGLYRPAANEVALAISGANLLTASTGALALTGTLSVSGAVTLSSTVSATSVSPTGSTVPANGLYLPSANTLGFAANSTEVLSLTSAGGTLTGVLTVTGEVDSNTGFWVKAGGYFNFQSGSTGAIEYGGTAAMQFPSATAPTVSDDGGTQQVIGFRGVTVTAITNANVTLALSHRGGMVRMVQGYTVTVPSSVFSPGDIVLINAHGGTGNVAISEGAGLSLYWADSNGTATLGNRNVAADGIVALIFVDNSTAYIVGPGIS